jgi:phosphatidylglycerophosphate synthase
VLDARLRPLIDPPLDRTARWLVRLGVTADGMTLTGFAVGMAAAGSIVLGQMWGALALICLNRSTDGLDGAIARAIRPTDRGGFLGIASDFVFYAAVPLAFALPRSDREAGTSSSAMSM